jgi:hypothetical protein
MVLLQAHPLFVLDCDGQWDGDEEFLCVSDSRL